MTKTKKSNEHPATWTSLHIPGLIKVFAVCMKEEVLGPWLLTEGQAKTDQTVQLCRLIRVFKDLTCDYVGFVMVWLKLY